MPSGLKAPHTAAHLPGGLGAKCKNGSPLTHFSVKSENLGKRRHVPSASVVFEGIVVASLLLYGILQKLLVGYWHPWESSSYAIWREESFHWQWKKVEWDFSHPHPCPIKIEGIWYKRNRVRWNPEPKIEFRKNISTMFSFPQALTGCEKVCS